MTLQLINRDPELGESGVPADSDIFLEIITTGDPIVNAETQVFVDGVLAYDGGTFQAGYNGPGSATSIPFPDIRQINIDPTFSFSSEQVVSVRVVTQTALGAETLDETYTFTVEDTTSPQVLSAIAVGTRTVRVKFNEQMTAALASNSDDALNPSNYSFQSQPESGIPAVEVVPVSVSFVSGFEFEIETDIELSPGVNYLLTVSGAQDSSGNEVIAPSNTALFGAFVPPQPSGRRFDIWDDMIPKVNKREDVTETLQRFVRCLQDVVILLLSDIDRWTDILDPDIAPEAVVDAMLQDLGNPFRFSLSLTDKRRLARTLVKIYKEKGLAEGIENAIRFLLGIEVVAQPCTVDGWILGESELGEDTILGPGSAAALRSFEIVASEVFTDEERDRVRKIAIYMKPVNTHLKEIIEPTGAQVIDHWELGFSELGETTLLH